MNKDTQGHRVDKCPLTPTWFENLMKGDDPPARLVCYPSCEFWRDDRCQFGKVVKELRGEIPPNPVGSAGDS